MSHAWIKPELLRAHREKWKAIDKVYRRCLDAGCKNLSYLDGQESLGTDGEGTLDGIHPNDCGFVRIAGFLFPAMQKALADKL